ncbi:MAG: MBL fold metallo-hydrolase, partial [Spirochaetes bacterium]
EKVKESVRRLAKLPIDIILFGHGDPIMEKGYVKLRELNLE